MAVETHAIPGARFMDPVVLARIGNLELVSRRWSTGSSTACTRRPTRRLGRLRGASRLCARRRHPADGLAAVGAHRSLLHQGARSRTNMNFSVLMDVSKSMDYGSQGHHEVRLRADSDRVSDQPRAPSARPRRLCRLRQRGRRARAAVGQAHGDGAARAGPAGRAARQQLEGAAAQAGRALRPPRSAGRDSGLL